MPLAMTFPVIFHLGSWNVPAHEVFETLGYLVGFQLFLLLRRRFGGEAIPTEAMLWTIVGAIFGALIGSRLLAWMESPDVYLSALSDPRTLFEGKTIVGGLLGGWAGVEIAKRLLGVRSRGGDLYVIPICIGTAIGRVGCFLTGLPDHTYGLHTTLPWGVDFGDGPRHPTQLYESAFMLLLAVALALFWRWRRDHHRAVPGELFRLFMLAYLSFRFLIEFIKPRYHPYLGLSMIQLACLAAILLTIWNLRRGRAAAAIAGLASAPPAAVA